MPAPFYSEALETLWSRLPDVIREEDARQLLLLPPLPGYESKTNYVPNPSFEEGTSNWSSFGAVLTTPAGSITVGSRTLRATTDITTGGSANTVNIPVIGGQPYWGAGVLRGPRFVSTRLRWRDASNANVGDFTPQYVNSNGPYALSVAAMNAPDNAAFLQLGVAWESGSIGDLINADAMMFTDGLPPTGMTIDSYLRDVYFDGSRVSDVRYGSPVWGWNGTPHASTSFQRAVPTDPGGFPLKRFLSGMLGQVQKSEDILNRLEYVSVVDGGAPGDTSDLVNALVADPEWFRWIAMVRGIRLNLSGTHDQQRAELLDAEGYTGGTKADIAKTAAQGLTGSKLVRIIPRSTTLANMGTQSPWEVMVVTRATETPSGYDPVKRVVDAGAKPAGVRLNHATYEGTWNSFETEYPNWNALDAAPNWETIEEAGL